MKTSKILCAPETAVRASLSVGLPAWGLNRFKQVVTGLLLGAALMATPAARAGNPELPVDLLSAGDFVILAKTGISTVPYSDITGDMGVSPIDRTAITGFSLIMDGSSQFSTSAQVTGKIYAADYATPTPSMMTTAIADMETAFTDAAGRSIPDTINFGATAGSDRDIGGLTMYPGLHKWSTGVLISTDVTLDAQGDPAAIFIFQISGDLTVASTQQVILSGGAQAKNIFWQVAGGSGAIIGTYAHFEGIVLTAKAIVVQTGASFNGKLLAQTAVTLDQNNIMDADLIPPLTVTLEIVSEHGTGLPPVGIYTNAYGVTLTNMMTDVETLGGTQYVNTGWSMIGNEPLAGITNAMLMVHTNDAVLTWNWSTNYYLSLTAVNGSITNEPAGWKPANWIYDLYPAADFGYTFDYWEVNSVSNSLAVPLNLTMDEAKDVVAIFRPLFIDVTSNVLWNVSWLYNPRKGYYTGTLTINNTSTKIIRAPVWFEVETTAFHWLRSPTGRDLGTGFHYLDVSAAVGTLNPGETATVTGIELMGRRPTDVLVVALWADPPGLSKATSNPLDTDGDGIPNAWEAKFSSAVNANNPFDASLDSDQDGVSNFSEYIADTNPDDSESIFTIRSLNGNAREIVWNGSPERVYTVWGTPSLSTPFSILASGIVGAGPETTFVDASDDTAGSSFYRVEVNLK